MPNWCFNDLRVSGPAADLKRSQNQAREVAAPQRTEHEPVPEVFSFQSLLPIPPELIGANSQGAARDWCLLHWGCRSRAVRTVQASTTRDAGVIYQFETPWSPPVPFLRKLSVLWPSLVFALNYEEPLAGFRGSARAAAGVMKHFCIDL